MILELEWLRRCWTAAVDQAIVWNEANYWHWTKDWHEAQRCHEAKDQPRGFL